MSLQDNSVLLHFVTIMVFLGGIVCGCEQDTETPPLFTGAGESTDEGGEESTDEGGEESTDEGGEESTDEPIGKEIGDPVALDHATALAIVKSNITKHMEGLDTALSFLEDSGPINNLIELFSEDEESQFIEAVFVEGEESVDGDEENAEAEGMESVDEDEGFEIDLSGLRDDVLEWIEDAVMVESAVILGEDGLSLTYSIEAQYFCVQEEEEDGPTPEERIKNEEECAERLANNPLRLHAMSDGDDQINLTLLVGTGEAPVAVIQLHGDLISCSLTLENMSDFLAAVIPADSIEMPNTIDGTVACEVRDESELKYTLRCGLPEGSTATPTSGQETFGFLLPVAEELLWVTLDGQNNTLDGALAIDTLRADLPWQWMVDLFHDSEEGEVEVCEEDPACAEDEDEDEDCPFSCWMESTPGPEAPEVEGTVSISLESAGGTLSYNASDDAFLLTGLTLGQEDLTVSLDGDALLGLALNSDHDRTLELKLMGSDMNLLFQTSPELNLEVTIGSWNRVLEPLPEMWEFKVGEIFGCMLNGADTPTMSILQGPDQDTEIQVSTGTMTLWSSEMTDDIVVSEGQCMGGEDEEKLSEEEKAAQHPLFGGLMGSACE